MEGHEGGPSKRLKVESVVVVALGACTIDTIMRVAELPSGDCKVLAQDAAQIASGMATSAACAAAKLGADTVLLGRIGADSLGDNFLECLKNSSVDTQYIKRISSAKTPLSAVIVDSAGRRMVVPYYDCKLGDDISWLPLPQILKNSKGSVLTRCCALADVRWLTGAELLLQEARKLGIPGVLDGDVAEAKILHRLVPLASHAIFSEPGFRIYAGGRSFSEALLSEVASAHRGVVGVTLGERGFAWADQSGDVWKVDAPSVKAIDTLAAGDVFHGAYATALAEGQSLENAAHFACTAAALKCTRFGGRLGTPSRLEVQESLKARENIAKKTYVA